MKALRSLLKSKPRIQHFKIEFPIPGNRVQSCIKKLQELSKQDTEAIFVSVSGFCDSPNTIQTLHNGFKIAHEKNNIPVFTFLEENATALTYCSANCGTLSADPYCVLGEAGTFHKSYTNIHKLLEFLGVKVDNLSTHDKGNFLWNPYSSPNETEKQVTQKWIDTVEEVMIKNISEARGISVETVKNISSKLMTPHEALQNKLIDHIQTMEEFKEKHFPQVRVEEHVYSVTSRMPSLTSGEVTLLMKMEEVISMPQIALFSTENPLNECIQQAIQMIRVRMEDPEKLEELDILLGNLFQKAQLSLQESHNNEKFML